MGKRISASYEKIFQNCTDRFLDRIKIGVVP